MIATIRAMKTHPSAQSLERLDTTRIPTTND